MDGVCEVALHAAQQKAGSAVLPQGLTTAADIGQAQSMQVPHIKLDGIQAPAAARPDYSAVDADVDRLAIKLEEHSHSMIRDVAQLMLDVKQRLALAKMVAVDGERHVAEQRLAVKQEEMDLLGDELLAARADLQRTSKALDRCAQGFANKVQKVKDRTKMLRIWAAWRAYALNRQRLRRKAAQADAWYQHHFLTHCVFEAWHRRARGNYRALALRRHEQNLAAALAEQAAVQARELQALRQRLADAEQGLAAEKEARDALEEDMRRAFLRGVTALNIEAMCVMKHGPGITSSSPLPASQPLEPKGQLGAAFASQNHATPSSSGQQPGTLNSGHADGHPASLSRSVTPDMRQPASATASTTAFISAPQQLSAPSTPPATGASQQQQQQQQQAEVFSAAAAIRSASTLPSGVRYCAPGVQAGQLSATAQHARPAPKVVVTRGPAAGAGASATSAAAMAAAGQRGGRNQVAAMHPAHPGNMQRRG